MHFFTKEKIMAIKELSYESLGVVAGGDNPGMGPYSYTPMRQFSEQIAMNRINSRPWYQQFGDYFSRPGWGWLFRSGRAY